MQGGVALLPEHAPYRASYPFVSSSPLTFLPGNISYRWPMPYLYFSVSSMLNFLLKDFKAQSLYF